MTHHTSILFIVLVSLFLEREIQAQILWEHKTYDAFINPDTQEKDSTVAYTAISSFGKCVTASAIHFSPPGAPVRITFYRSNDNGLTWFEQATKIPNKPNIMNHGITKIQQIDSLHVVAIGDYGTVYRTSDAGVTWHRRDLPGGREMRDIHFSNALEGIAICVGANNTSDSAIFTTTNGGINWENTHSADNYMSSCYSYGNGKFRIFEYWRGPFYTTNDNFATLDTSSLLIDSLVDPKPRFVFTNCDFSGGDTLFALGTYWPKDVVDALGSYSAIMRSTDDGKTWEKPWVYKTDTLARIKHITSPKRDTMFAAGGDLSFYLMSTDRGATWRADSLMLDTLYDPWNKCFGMTISEDGHPVAIFGPGPVPFYSLIWRGKYIKSSTGLVEVMRYHTKLYPNPSSGRLTVELKGLSRLPITITDMLGRVVAKGRMDESGKAEFDFTQKPRGIYYAMLTFDGNEYMVGKLALTID